MLVANVRSRFSREDAQFALALLAQAGERTAGEGEARLRDEGLDALLDDPRRASGVALDAPRFARVRAALPVRRGPPRDAAVGRGRAVARRLRRLHPAALRAARPRQPYRRRRRRDLRHARGARRRRGRTGCAAHAARARAPRQLRALARRDLPRFHRTPALEARRPAASTTTTRWDSAGSNWRRNIGSPTSRG